MGKHMNKERLHYFAGKLEEGDWRKAVDFAVKSVGLTSGQIREVCDSINFYPSEEFWKYTRQRTAEVTAMRDLNRIFNDIVNS